MTTSEWVQIILMIILVSATIFYAYQAKKASGSAKASADASVRMAEEMRNARFALLRPIISVVWIGSSLEQRVISAFFENTGVGPALNLKCYLTQDKFNFQYKHDGYTVMGVKEKHSISLPSENFDFKAWSGLAINCDYESIFGEKFRSILRYESEENRSLEITKLNSGDRND